MRTKNLVTRKSKQNLLPVQENKIFSDIKNGTGNFLNGFNFFVIHDDKAYDVPAGDDCLTDDNIGIIGGFYSGDIAFATAQAINSGVIKISKL